MIEAKIGFSSRYLDNYHVIGRCLQLLEGTCVQKLGLEAGSEVEGLAQRFSIDYAQFVDSIEDDNADLPKELNKKVILSEYGNYIKNKHYWIEVVAYLLYGKCVLVTATPLVEDRHVGSI